MKDDIRQAVRDGRLRKGERLVPLRQLAEQYGVSFGTAKAVMGHLQREGLVAKRVGSGTYVTFDPHLESDKLGTPVHIWLSIGAASDHMFQEMANELQGLLQAKRIETRGEVWRLNGGAEQAADLMRGWESQPPRALVTRWEFPAVGELLRRGTPPGMRVIATFGNPQFLPGGWHSVNPDQMAIGRLAVERLAGRGHRRVGFVTYSRVNNPRPPMVRCRSGEWLVPQLVALGIALRDKGLRHALAVCHSPGVSDEQASNELAVEHAVRWLSRPNRPSALVGEDSRLIIMKRAAERLGLRVPQDLELLGIGATAWSQGGNFSSISCCPDLMAREMAKLIEADDTDLDGAVRHVMIQPKLIIR